MPKPDKQRLIAARASRDLDVRLAVAGEVAKIEADLRSSVDPSPLATATWTAAQ